MNAKSVILLAGAWGSVASMSTKWNRKSEQN